MSITLIGRLRNRAMLWLCVCAFCGLGVGLLRADGPVGLPKVGDTIPELKLDSIEGPVVSLRPPAGRLLHIHFWNPSVPSTEKLTKRAIVLYRRFHTKGLNALTICMGANEERSLQLPLRWNIPWLTVADGGKSGPLRSLGVPRPPFDMLVDSQGKVVAVKLEGDKAHELVARLLNVDLADVPMPKEPEPRKVNKSPGAFDEDRDLVHGNPKIYLAATPAGPDAVELVWSARGLPGSAGHRKDSYSAYMLLQRELFAPYQAELQASHSFKEGFRKLGEVAAGDQHYLWKEVSVGKLLWYRLVLRDDEHRVVAVSDVVPAAVGPNLLARADFESPDSVGGTREKSWSAVAPQEDKPADPADAIEIKLLAETRPFSTGKQCIALKADAKVIIASPMAETDSSRQYILGGWVHAMANTAVVERVAFDKEHRSIGGAETALVRPGNPWVFFAHRLVTDADAGGKPGDWQAAEAEKANLMPEKQAGLRVELSVEGGQACLDDVFLIAYDVPNDQLLEALPAAEQVKRDEAAAEVFADRRELAIIAEEDALVDAAAR